MEENTPRYVVGLSNGQYARLTEQEYNEIRDDLFKSDAKAQVSRINDFSFDDDVNENANYVVTMPDGKYTVLSAAQYQETKEDLRNSGYQVGSLSHVDYYGDKLKAINDEINALKPRRESALAAFNDTANNWDITADPEDIDVGSAVKAARRSMQAKSDLDDVNGRLDTLYREREANPAWQEQKNAKLKYFTDETDKIDGMFRQLDEANPASAKVAGKSIAGLDSRTMDSDLAFDMKRNPDYYRDKAALTAAKMFYKDATKAEKAPSRYDDTNTGFGNFFRGLVGEAPETLSAVALAKSMGENIPLGAAIKKIHEAKGNDTNIVELVTRHPEQLAAIGLSEAQREMLTAFVAKSATDWARAEDLSLGYQAGSTAMQSLGYMADFFLMGGMGESAAKGATKWITKGIAQASVETGLKGATRKAVQAVPKFMEGTLQAHVKSLVMTPFMPSSYANFLDNLYRINNAGEVDLSGKAINKAVQDVFIENLSESAGTQVEAILGAPFKIANIKFGAWGNALKNSPMAKIMTQAGWNGYIGEIGEEWYGNALRVMTGVDKDALKDFATVDQQIITLTSFAPMSVIGGGTSAAQYLASKKQMAKAGEILSDVLARNGYDSEQIQAYLDVTKAENPTELANKLAPVIVQSAQDNGDASAVYKAVMDYAQAVARYRTLDGISDADIEERRQDMMDEITAQMGSDNPEDAEVQWFRQGQVDIADGETLSMPSVRVLTDENGSEMFVVGDVQEDGRVAVVDRATGRKHFANVSDATLQDTGNMSLNDYLDRELVRRRDVEDAARMQQETQLNRQQLLQKAQPGMQVNIGTAENPVTGTIMQYSGDVFVVESSEGGLKQYTEQEIANMLDLPLAPVSQESQEETDAEILEAQDDLRERAKAAIGQNIAPVIGTEGDITLEMVHRPVQTEEGVQYQVDYNDNGQQATAFLSEDQVAAIAGLAGSESVNQVETTEDAAVEDATPRDFRGNPLPMRTNKRTGEQVVDENALWNRDPEAWARWNETNPHARVTSKARLEDQIKDLAKAIEKDTKAVQNAALKGIDADKMDDMEFELAKKLDRRNLLQSIIDKYNMPVAAGSTIAGEQRKAQAEAVKEEQKAGFPGIKQRWDNAPKSVGAPDELRLPNGETVAGHYVLTEAGVPTPSHNPADSFKMTDGFPVDENGKTVNDRDYEHDKAAQASVLDKAANYDQRALQTPVIVSADGVVLSGNDRTMASQIAAANNTDAQYTGYLGKFSQKYGFSADQVGQFAHPRVVFVPDAEMPYNAATFAKFNAEDKKSQSKTEKAVKAGKTITPEVLGSLASLVDRYDDINALYNDAAGVDELLNVLLSAEVITTEQVAALKDGDKLSGTGMDMLESTLIGAALDEEAVRIAMSDASIRKSVVSAVSQIILGNTLADYNLRAELTDAITLVAAGKAAKEIKFGESVQSYIRQQHLFVDDVVAEATVQMLADAINDRRTSFLKKVLSLYNRDATDSVQGQLNLLTGDILTREAILRNILEYLGYDTRIIFDTSEREAEQRASAEQPAEGSAGQADQAQQNDAPVQSDAGSPVATFSRDEVAAILEQGNVGDTGLVDYMTDDEIAEFMRLWEAFLPFNDELGEAYNRLGDDLRATANKKKRAAAQAEIDRLELAQEEAFAPVQEYVDSLLEKYDLSVDTAPVMEDEVGDEEPDPDEPKPTKGKKGSKKGKEKKAEEQPYVVKGGASEATIAKQTYTQEEWDEIVYGYSVFGVFESKKTKEQVQIYMVDDMHPVYRDHSVIVSRRLPGPNGVMSTETHTTTDYLIKYLKANKFAPALDDRHKKPYKNKHGYWMNTNGVCTNPIRIELPSVRKGWANFSEASFWQDDNDMWHANGYTAYGTGSGSLGVHDTYATKSDAIRAVIEALKFSQKAHPEKNRESKDRDNLLRTLMTKTLPQAMMDEGVVDNVTRLEINVEDVNNGVQGLLFGNEGETEAPAAEEKPKRKRTSKKKSEKTAEAVEEDVETTEGMEDEEEADVVLEDEEGTPGNFHWIAERICTNPQIITMPGADKRAKVPKLVLAEKNGLWYSATYVTADGGKGSSWGDVTFISNYTSYDSREEAIKKAVEYMRWLLNNPGRKAEIYGETFNETKSLIDYLVTMELPKEDAKKQETTDDALVFIKKALDNFASNGNYARVVHTLEAYQDFFGEDVAQEIDNILSDLRKNGISKESKDEMIRRTAELYNRLVNPEAETEEPVQAETPAAPAYGSQNTIITTEKYEELKQRMKEKLGQLNAGFDPEVFFIGAQMAAYHVEAGARKFVDFAQRMIADLGDGVRPYLKAIYNGARDLPGMEEFKPEMDSAAEVEDIDVDAITLEEQPQEEETSTEPQKEGRTFSGADTEIQGLEGISSLAVYEDARTFINDVMEGVDDFNLVDMIVIGSRAFGTAREDSDLDILVEYDGDMKEDAAFNILNDEHLEIMGIKVDFFPIRAEESGTLTTWLESHDNGRPVAKEQQKEETKANEPSVREINVEGLLGAVSDMYQGKRNEVKLSDFAEPVQDERPHHPSFRDDEPISARVKHFKTDFIGKTYKNEDLYVVESNLAGMDDAAYKEVEKSEYNGNGGHRENVNKFYFFDEDSAYNFIYNLWGVKRDELPAKMLFQKPSAELPEIGGQTVGELGKYTHTKTGKEMTIVRLTGERVSADEFKQLKARAKELGGYYSSFGGAKGFLFENEEDAIKFNTINNTQNAEEQTDEQTAADTAAISSEAAAIVGEAQSLAEAEKPDEREVAAAVTKIDAALDAIDDQLALLGFYEADQNSPFHESYGYMKSAEKKAVKDADRLAKKLAADLGIDVGRKQLAKANIAPAGGEVTFRLPLNEGRELYVVLYLRPDGNDNLSFEGRSGHYSMDIMYRVENPSASGYEKFGTNYNAPYNISYKDLLKRIRSIAKDFLPDAPADILQLAKEQAEKNRKSKKKSVSSQQEGDEALGGLFATLYDAEEEQTAEDETPAPAGRVKPTEVNGYSIGEKVFYTPNQGKRAGIQQEATIYDFEYDGQPVIDAGLGPVLYEVVEWNQIEKLVKNTEDGLQRLNETSTEGSPADGGGQQQRLQRGTGEESEVPGQEGERTDRGGEGGREGNVHGQSRALRPRYDDSVKRNTRNYRRGKDDESPKTVAARYKANMAAIRLLKELQDSGKQATREQMAVLRQYTGWGGLGGYFNNEYSPDYREMRSLLTDEEMQAAALSINTAYYTPTEIIDSMWDIAKRLGFEGGNVLEGSAGIGNILASMPKGISERSAITAVELDNITGGILQLLYPDANVQIKGFQEVDIPNGSVDLAITNVPFGDINVYDAKEKDITRKFGGKIHDFCIAKNIRKLVEGGIGIFISTRGTLDGSSKALRQWIVNEGNADVIGAFRLNNETFEGTKATSDIIVVRKRVSGQVSPNAINVTDTEITRRVDYQTTETEWNRETRSWEPVKGKAAMEINSYFVEHPENMGGEMGFGFEHNDSYRPGSSALWPTEKIDQAKRLAKWAKQFSSMQEEVAPSVSGTESVNEETSATKEGQLVTNSKGEICISRSGKAVPIAVNAQKVKGYTKAQALADYDALKTAINDALEYQLTNESDEGLKPLLDKLNRAYDRFAKRYERLNRNTAISFLRYDVDFPSIAAVEDYQEKKGIDGKVKIVVKKTSIFSGRVLGAKRVPTPSNAKDGVIVSINQFGRIDIPFIAKALEKDEETVRKEILASGLGFENPITGNVEVEYEYLSGNVREKLEYARAHNTEGQYDKNVEALEKIIPADIPAHLIEFSLGSDWMPVELYTGYAKEKFGVNDNFVPTMAGGSWILPENTWEMGVNTEQNRAAGVHSEKLRTDKMGHELMLAAMNNTSIVFSRSYKDSATGETVTEHDKEATQAATTKMSEMRDDFKEWCKAKMLDTPELAERIAKIYNDTFNAVVPKEIRNTFIPEHFEGMATKLNNGKPLGLRLHQAKAVIRATTEPLMMAHEVGTGKTFTLIATAMEMRRLGTAKKPMIVVQNATLGQFVTSAKEIYPNAKILTISEADRTAEGRSAFYAKIKYNDWDMIVVPQSVFEMIPDSEERQRAFIQEKIEEKKFILEQVKDAKNSAAERQLKKELEDLEYEYQYGEKPPKKGKKDAKREAEAIENAVAKAKKQLDRRTDDVSDFDDMGIDALLIDEAHSYKHLGFSTAMQRGVKGVDASGSKKSAGVYLKTRAVFDKVGWKNVVFATGTPISNTAAEIWTFMKYLMPADVMRQHHIYYFDDFVRNFGNISQSLEFTTSGKFRENTRFASYTNLPELIRIWSSVTDTVRSKDAVAEGDEKLEDKQPKMEGGQARDIYLPQSLSLVDIMNAVRARLEWYENLSGKEKKENSHIPLTMFGIAKMAAIDPRLVDRNAPDEPNSKTNKAVEETLRALKDSERYKGTAALFCDNFRRWDSSASGKRVEGFNIFEEIKRKLVAAGVPEGQIVIMKSGMNTAAKEKIFARVNSGEVRVIMGTTATLGTGVNIQERLFFEAHLDAPNRPMDYTQRRGRILRQGNLLKEWGIPVRIVRFGVEDSLDVTAYQRLSTKEKFIDSIMNGKPLLANGMENRVLEEEDESEFDNPVAVLSGSQYALRKSQAERELRKLRNKKEQHRQDQIYIERTLKENRSRIAYDEKLIEHAKENLSKVKSAFPDGTVKEIIIEGRKVKGAEQIAETIKEKITTPLRSRLESRRVERGFTNETRNYTMSFDGVSVSVKVEVDRTNEYDEKRHEYRPVIRTRLEYSVPRFGIEDRFVSGGYIAIKDIVPDFMGRIATGRYFEDSVNNLTNTVNRLSSDNELMLQRRGKPFADEEKLSEQEKIVADYTEKMKAELAEKEAKYAEMAKNAKTNFNLEGVEVDEEEEEHESSIVAEEGNRLDVGDTLVLAEAVTAVNRLAKRLNLKVKFDDTLESKGAYSGKNGIRINLSNCESVADAVETLLHEGVAHFGLRQLLGNEGMNEFISDILKNATNNIKARIREIAQEQGRSLEYAAEEYVAELAEKTDYTRSERSLWRKIVEFLRNVFDTVTGRQNHISDDTIRELLIASYENLEGMESEVEYDDEIEHYRLRTKPAPKNTGIGYKVFFKKGDNLYPPMVNPTGEATPVGVWLDAEAAPVVETSKTGRPKVKAGGKGTQGGSGTLAYRPGWHLGEIPYALQFNRLNPETGKKDLFPKDFVWAEVEYAADKVYQKEAEAEGITENGKFQHSLAGLKKVPEDGFYRYRTNPNPETEPWIITGAMKVNRVLSDEEVDEIVRESGREPQTREGVKDARRSIWERYENQDGDKWPWMYEPDVIEAIEREVPYGIDTEHLFSLIDKYKRLKEEDFEEGRRDFSSGEAEDVFEEILDELQSEPIIRNRVAYHGSAANFDAFDIDHAGEGEGNQAHGFGHYVALDRETSVGYAWNNAIDKADHDGKLESYVLEKIYDDSYDDYDSMVERYNELLEIRLEELQEELEFLREDNPDSPGIERLEAELEPGRYRPLDEVLEGMRNLYTVEIPDDNGRNYIDEDGLMKPEDIEAIYDELNRISEDKENELSSIVRTRMNDVQEFFGKKDVQQTGKEMYQRLSVVLGSDKEASRLLNRLGWVGIKYEGSIDNECAVIFSNKDLKIMDHERFRPAGVEGFISNAEQAAQRVKMEKATPVQWLKMLEKEGGLKAGEDKWIGLSDWLNNSEKKTLSKQEVLDYIRQNEIQIEEVSYVEEASEALRQEAAARLAQGRTLDELQEEIELNLRLAGDELENMDESDIDEWLMEQMTEKYGDDFSFGYYIEDGRIEYSDDPYDVDVREFNRENPDTRIIHPTRLQYTTDGLDNKREIALTVPTIEPWNEKDDVHFGEAGEGRAIAWVRFGDAVIGLNGRALFIDEIQSKRHQEAREQGGYKGEDNGLEKAKAERAQAAEKMRAAESELSIFLDSIYGNQYNAVEGTLPKEAMDARPLTDEENGRLGELQYAVKQAKSEWDAAREKVNEIGLPQWNRTVPAAPFEKNWHELAMKRMLRLAAEEGYDVVAWTTGDQQAERYNIGGVVDSIERQEHENIAEKQFKIYLNGSRGSQYITTDNEGRVVNTLVDDFRNKNLSDIVGKEMAVKMLQMKENDFISGENMRVGGEGMKGFYDEILPRFMNKYGKKWGVQVEDKTLYGLGNGPMKVHAVRITPEMKESVMQGQLMFREGVTPFTPSPVSYTESMGARRLAVQETATKCGIEIEFRPSSQMQFNGKPLAGRWINGKMYICLEHCRDNADAIRTVLHEGVGHNGLRRLIGNENMTDFCLDVFHKLPKETRNEIANAAVTRYGGNVAEAVEEYLAERAEVMDFENGNNERGFWDIVLDGLRKVLAKVGIDIPLSQRDVRWLMWQSYNANKQSDILNLAKRQVVARRLGFTLSQQADKAEGVQVTRNRIAEEVLAPAARIYNKDVVYWMNRLHESWVDKDNAVHSLVAAIEKATGKAAATFEDIRLSLNQQGSKGLAAIEKFEREFWTPMQDAIRALMKEKGIDLNAVERYVMIKHGLERNEVFAKRDAREFYQGIHDRTIEVIDKLFKDGRMEKDVRDMMVAKEDSKLEKRKKAIEEGTDKKYLELRENDYGGLTALYSEFDAIEPFMEGVESEEEYKARVIQARHPKYTKEVATGMYDEEGNELTKTVVDVAAMEEAAQAEVAGFENGSERSVEELWKRINAATKHTIKHQYDANMMSREQYLHVKDMFKYYVPLRGFAENTAENMYEYYMSDQRRSFEPPLLKAKGRKTEAESPFGYIGSMASSGIAADMKNETKLALYYFVSNRAANDLVTISEVWYEKDGVDEDGKSIFKPVYPPFKEDLSSADAKKAYEDWENGMKEKASKGLAFKGTRKLDLHKSVIHIDRNQAESHVIKFKVGGRDMMMYINGNPRAAQAINNELNVEMSTDYQKVFGKILRWFSGINTSYNPEFWLSNAQRDALFAIMSVNVKDDPAYNEAFRKNFGMLFRNTLVPGKKGGAYSLKRKLDSGKLGDSSLEKLYQEFVENGGVTGYTTLKNNEEWELELRKYTGQEKTAMHAVKKGFEAVQHFGEAIEQMTRFAAFVTSREQGKDIKDAVNDAKELTVNFNRKGSGKSITFKEASRLRTKDGKKLNGVQKAFVVGASWLPVYGRRFIMFFNASVQGLNSMYKLFKKNPSRMGTWAAAYLALGVIQAVIHGMLDDDDDYLDIPDYERRNNLLLGGNGAYFKWALPQECRVFYGLGDMIVNHAMGRSPHKSIAGEMLASASDIAPLNPAGGISALTPSALTPVVEVALNRDYKGSKIYNDMRYLSDEERKRTPKYTMAYQGTGRPYVLMSQFANWLSGGDYADAGWLNINPASVEHILQGATGGAGTTIGKLYRGTVGQVLGEDFAVRNTPFLSRILTVTDDRYRNAHTTELFDYYKAEAEHTKKLINTYRKNGDKKLDRLFESEDYEIMVVYESYKDLMKYYNDELKYATDLKERKALMREQDALRKNMILEISNIGNND